MDVYRGIAAAMLNIPEYAVTPEQRAIAKSCFCYAAYSGNVMRIHDSFVVDVTDFDNKFRELFKYKES